MDKHNPNKQPGQKTGFDQSTTQQGGFGKKPQNQQGGNLGQQQKQDNRTNTQKTPMGGQQKTFNKNEPWKDKNK